MSVSTVVTMRPAATVFREEQYFDWRVYALIAAFELVAGYCLVWVTRHWGPVGALLEGPENGTHASLQPTGLLAVSRGQQREGADD